MDHKNTIERELFEQREKFLREQNIILEVNRIFDENELHRKAIRQKLSDKQEANTNVLDPKLLDPQKIFHVSQIRTVCINYRLRFLSSHHFRHNIPEEAISKIRQLEATHDIALKGFMIMAPTKSFTLENDDDPFLFAPLGNDYFYLIHKWGKDIKPLRKWLVKPFKNILNFVLFSLAISALVTFLTPETDLSRQVHMAGLIIFLFAFKSVFAVFLYSFFMLGKNFNSAIWNRKYYNN
jgi:hypothetical protein